MREIVLDTEITGLDPLGGHRVVEIGAVELVDHAPTGRTFHCYLNPERAVPAQCKTQSKNQDITVTGTGRPNMDPIR